MSEPFDKKEILKSLIKKLHQGAKVEEIKEKFKEMVKEVTSTEIAQIEEELVKEGISREEIQRLCKVHLAVFKESLEKEETLAPQGHPIYILREEHKMLLKFVDEFKGLTQKIREKKDISSIEKEIEEIAHIEEHLKDSESHYLREENVLFPYLEKHGITQPPAIMWSEHNEIREIKKKFYELLETQRSMNFQEFIKKLETVAIAISDMLSNHIYKENNILFPTALKVILENEWSDISKQFNEVGYCCFTPESAKVKQIEKPVSGIPAVGEGKIIFETGNLSKEEIETIFNTLPVDITFVDKDDTVCYFSQSKERIFLRTKAVIGRKVQQCHPEKSLHKVEQILNDFKNKKRDVADFWVQMKGHLIYIRYFAVRDKNGEYLGCLEVTQDITEIKKIEGEKRLL